jgi:hypothetical protein
MPMYLSEKLNNSEYKVTYVQVVFTLVLLIYYNTILAKNEAAISIDLTSFYSNFEKQNK